MRKAESRSVVGGLALALSLINIGLLVFAVRWTSGMLSEVAETSESESVQAAAEKIDQASTTVENIVYLAAWTGGLVLVLLLLPATVRQWRRSSRDEQAARLRSYTRNLARVRRDSRRRRDAVRRPSSRLVG